jgi:predicted ABC-type ATPase
VSEGDRPRPSIYVLAGTNGAGKSSIAGATIRSRGADYFNPDEATNRIIAANPGIDPREANGVAWLQGKRLLERAISTRSDFALETTLGGNTMPALLESAHENGLAVRVWYVGLQGPDLHIARVGERVAAGGHDIPEEKIREWYDRGRQNLIRLLPMLTQLLVYDNSREGDPRRGDLPHPFLILSMLEGRIREHCDLAEVPDWAKSIFQAAIEAYQI